MFAIFWYSLFLLAACIVHLFVVFLSAYLAQNIMHEYWVENRKILASYKASKLLSIIECN